MKMKRVAILAALALLALPGNVLAVEITEVGSISDKGSTAIQNAFEASGIPSVHAAIVINGSLYWAKGYGYQPTLDTAFRAGSITKSFTAAAFLKLYENGTIDLDDDVSDYLPFQVRNPNEPSTVITIRMILNHRAGMSTLYQFGQPWSDPTLVQFLEDNGIPSGLPEVPNWNGIRLPLHDIINSTNINDAGAWLSHTGDYAYSNTGYFFLSFLLEHIIDDTWSNYITHNILAPLGMDSTGFNVTQYEKPLAFPYTNLENGSLLQLPVFRDYAYGAGGLITTVMDLSKFYIAVMNEGKYGDVELYQPQYAALMKQYTQPNSNLIGYSVQTGMYEATKGKGGAILFCNWPGGATGTIYTELLREVRSIIYGNETLTTTTPPTTPPPPIPDLLLVGSFTLIGAIAVVIVVVVLKRR